MKFKRVMIIAFLIGGVIILAFNYTPYFPENLISITPTVILSSSVEFKPTPIITSLPTWIPTFTPAPSELSGYVVFTYLTHSEFDTVQIFFADLDTRKIQQLTFLGENRDPNWSPDGQQIAFTSTRGEFLEIYIMNKDGGEQKRLTNFEGKDYDPAWSPDGTKLAFTSNYQGDSNIYIKDFQTGELFKLTSGSEPSWSSDGKRIMFFESRYLSVINTDGSNSRRLVNDSFSASEAIWCPDDMCIIYESTIVVDDIPNLFIVDVATGRTNKLFNNVDVLHGDEYGLSKSPKSGYIVFSSGFMLYAFDMENNRLYPLGIQGLDANLYP